MTEKDSTQLDKLLNAYQAPLAPKGYQAMFWAKAIQCQPVKSLFLGWQWRMAFFGLIVLVFLAVGITQAIVTDQQIARLNAEEVDMLAQADIVEHLDELSNFEIIKDLDIIEHLDDNEVG